MEVLSKMILAAVHGGLLEGFKVGNASFSHLLLANDTMCTPISSSGFGVRNLLGVN
jgi:hypothetical protein